ncbi:Na-translocating system protein MpsC family protein [Alkalibacillus aidingensis]|uniref:Na-translocating system protein MpsC family protein n=1 Tax=Alkalibacillus aidingensis TaxID=2747607 RepID=UPI002948BF93|nr:Na-translocating system protein MpsC family protein [Alkalibacillus aidingensis]
MNNDKLNEISSYMSKLLRKSFGRGPKSCQAVMSDQFLVIYVRGFISPMEEVLMEQGQEVQVEKARSAVINHLIDELTGVIQVSLGIELEEPYDDWNF